MHNESKLILNSNSRRRSWKTAKERVTYIGISNSTSTAAKILGEIVLSILRICFSLLNLALKTIWQRAEGFVSPFEYLE